MNNPDFSRVDSKFRPASLRFAVFVGDDFPVLYSAVAPRGGGRRSMCWLPPPASLQVLFVYRCGGNHSQTVIRCKA